MKNLWNIVYAILTIILICVIIKKYREYCSNIYKYTETYNERFGIVSDSREHFDMV